VTTADTGEWQRPGQERPQEPPAPLGGKVRKALSWSFANMVVGRLGILLTGIIMARLLDPDDFGVFAVALVALTVMLSVNELGISRTLVRWQGDLDEIAPTAVSLSVISSGLTYAGVYAAAPWFASAMGSPEATGVLRLLCLAILIDAVTAVPVAKVTRQFRQGLRMFSDFTTLAVSVGIQIWLAVAGYGAWSLAWGRLGGNVVGALILVIMAPGGISLGWDKAKVKELLVFSLPLAASTLLTVGMLNLDKVVVGGLLDTATLGLYVLAFNLSSWPVNVFSMAVRRVSLAGFSQLTHDPTLLKSSFNRATTLLLAVTVPVCVLLGTLAEPAITFVYGAKWAAGAEALRWLALLGAVRVVTELAADYLVAVGRAAATMWLQGLWTAVLLPALALGAATGGLRGVGIAHAAVALVLVTPAFAVALHRAGLPLRPLAGSLARPLAGGAAAVAAVGFVLWLVDGTFAVLALGGLAGMAAYLPVVAPLRQMMRS
jgi:O-antigen/teichoic acid export membrane protein